MYLAYTILHEHRRVLHRSGDYARDAKVTPPKHLQAALLSPPPGIVAALWGLFLRPVLRLVGITELGLAITLVAT